MAKDMAVISHWHHLMEGLQESPQQFYSSLDSAIKIREIPNSKLSRVDYKEGGLLSAKREYFRVIRREHVFDICAAPFGNSFFVSWWLAESQGCLSLIPFIGPLLVKAKPDTYFRHDTAIMFQELVHSAVLQVIDGITKTKGLRALSENERKPTMRGFLK